MTDAPLPVWHWPTSFDQTQNLLVVTVDTPNTSIRDSARQRVRTVLREILGGLRQDIELISLPGQPIRLVQQNSPIGISVSHEAGLSLLAINFSGPVGVDLMQLPEDPDWLMQIPALASDYLGPQSARQLAVVPLEMQLSSFAAAWTRHEARLKCLGLGLQEWQPALEEDLSNCRVQPLLLPAGYVGAVARAKAVETPGA